MGKWTKTKLSRKLPDFTHFLFTVKFWGCLRVGLEKNEKGRRDGKVRETEVACAQENSWLDGFSCRWSWQRKEHSSCACSGIYELSGFIKTPGLRWLGPSLIPRMRIYINIYISTYLACSVYRGLVGNERSLDDYNNPTSSQGGISFQGVRSCWSLYRVWLGTSTLFSRRLFIRIYTPRKLPKARDCITWQMTRLDEMQFTRDLTK